MILLKQSASLADASMHVHRRLRAHSARRRRCDAHCRQIGECTFPLADWKLSKHNLPAEAGAGPFRWISSLLIPPVNDKTVSNVIDTFDSHVNPPDSFVDS